MKGKKERIDTAPSAAPLTSSPFADLLGKIPQDLPKVIVSSSTGAKAAEGRAEVPFRIARTRKGGYPIFIERRAAGKTVTVIRNVSGDTESLLAMLKKHCAAGGKAFEDSVEVQGDHCAKVEALFRQKGLQQPKENPPFTIPSIPPWPEPLPCAILKWLWRQEYP